MVDQTTLPSLMHSFVGQSSIKELCPPARIVLQYGNSFPASTRTKIKWTCRKPDVRATPRNKLIYCQNSAEVILVQVLLLLRSSTHTHTHTHKPQNSFLSALRMKIIQFSHACFRFTTCCHGHHPVNISPSAPMYFGSVDTPHFAAMTDSNVWD